MSNLPKEREQKKLKVKNNPKRKIQIQKYDCPANYAVRLDSIATGGQKIQENVASHGMEPSSILRLKVFLGTSKPRSIPVSADSISRGI